MAQRHYSSRLNYIRNNNKKNKTGYKATNKLSLSFEQGVKLRLCQISPTSKVMNATSGTLYTEFIYR